MVLTCKICIFRNLAASWTLKRSQPVSQNSRQLFLIHSKCFFKWWEEKRVLQVVVYTKQYRVSHFNKCSGTSRKLSALSRRHPPPLFSVCWDGAFGCWQFLGEIVCCFVWDGRRCSNREDTKTLMPLPWLLKSDHCDLKKKKRLVTAYKSF